MKPALVVQGRGEPGYARIEVRAGRKGRGQQIHAAEYWPQYDRSAEMAERACRQAARLAGYEIVGERFANGEIRYFA